MEAAPKKVLVAEGDEIVLVLISHILSRYAYVVHRAASAAETEAMLAAEHYDVVLLASTMPDANGDFIDRLLAAMPSLQPKLIVLTNGADSDTLGELGVHAVLRKPVEIYHLLETVRACAGRN